MVDKPIFPIIPPIEPKDQIAQSKEGIPINIPTSSTLGKYMLSGATKPPLQEEAGNQYGVLDYTGGASQASAIYFALVFQLPKWMYWVEKVDEWIEVHPTHKEYYERTIATRQMLEGTIKTGLASAASAVADYELVHHDLRKYKEILEYFAKDDENSLKSMFIDQVDVHTPEGVSMRSIAPRWSTIITDFYRLADEDIDAEKIQDKLKLSRPEALILSVKNRLYIEWKKLFFEAVKERYGMLKGLAEGRKKSIHEYREWLKPYISRFKMTRLGGARPKTRADILRGFVDVTGQSTFTNNIVLWAWRPHKAIEPKKVSAELTPEHGGFAIHPYDSFVREHFILNKRVGLAKLYPWLLIDKKYCTRCKKYMSSFANRCEECKSVMLQNRKYADEIVEERILKPWLAGEKFLDPSESYYILHAIDVLRVGTRLQVGEMENIIFRITTYVMSHNILLVKLLELECRSMELERYIDEILGVKTEEREIEELIREEFPKVYGELEKPKTGVEKFFSELADIGRSFTGAFGKRPVSVPAFAKPGPYEKDFLERITKQYLNPSGIIYGEVANFIKARMGVK